MRMKAIILIAVAMMVVAGCATNPKSGVEDNEITAVQNISSLDTLTKQPEKASERLELDYTN